MSGQVESGQPRQTYYDLIEDFLAYTLYYKYVRMLLIHKTIYFAHIIKHKFPTLRHYVMHDYELELNRDFPRHSFERKLS